MGFRGTCFSSAVLPGFYLAVSSAIFTRRALLSPPDLEGNQPQSIAANASWLNSGAFRTSSNAQPNSFATATRL